MSEYLEIADEAKKLTTMVARVCRLENGGERFWLYKTKNNSVGRPQEVDFPRLTDEPTCPSKALMDFLEIRRDTNVNEPLFIDERGRHVCPERFNDKLRQLMAVIEPDLKGRFTSKSFRIGMTSDAFALRVEEVDMRMLGRWAPGSTAYLSYVMSLARAERAAGVQRQVAQMGRNSEKCF